MGFTVKAIQSEKSRKGSILRTRPNPTRLKSKLQEIGRQIKLISKQGSTEQTLEQINLVNSQIRGVINYYEAATCIASDLNKYSWNLKYLAAREMKKIGGHLIPANQSDNFTNIHKSYTTKIPALSIDGTKIGLTSLSFCKWRKIKQKNQRETPFTPEGRELYQDKPEIRGN